ncbi:MAG: UDP-N-acetylmuramoyl-tripeptide--D-alanyl-D-alanine ligase [Gammaproteobacteria bacterium]|nr:UDP-N-acetylmuramoyl-tripeptide--D-alanyl-D-alanine ligase [Gammaproteobacteria bacterium]
MIAVKLSYIAQQLGWRLLGPDQVITQLVTDSRLVQSGDCFIALYGDNFDAHQFVEQVVAQGAAVLIVSQAQSIRDTNVSQLVVNDTRAALGQLAGLNRQLCGAKLIAITGSCGKTTVKEMIAAILAQRGQVLATLGNFNNDIGVPLTLLRLTKDDEFAVIELGANHLGEIDYSSALVKPDVALITNIGAAHLEGFGSIDGVAQAKSEIFNHLGQSGEAIFDHHSDYVKDLYQLNHFRKVTTFSSEGDKTAKFYAYNITMDTQGRVSFILCNEGGEQSIILALPGLHNVANALAAAAASFAVGATLEQIEAGLRLMDDVSGRLNVTQLTQKLTVIDDTYNANNTSVAAAIKLLGRYSGQRILVLGDMGELGEHAIACHQNLGPIIEQQQIELLLTIGTFSQYYASGFTGHHQHFEDKESLNLYIEQQLRSTKREDTTTVLVKGSRSAKMEQVIGYIKALPATVGGIETC